VTTPTNTNAPSARPKRFGILVAGGPAPGINSVIGAATLRALIGGHEVVGIRDGMSWLMQGNIDHVENLTSKRVHSIHFRGGSDLGISRANPTKDPAKLDAVLGSLGCLSIDKLITIGGDDTAFSAYSLEKRGAGRVKVAHVPKTIDNDLDLPPGVPTFGFETARQLGVELVRNIAVDAKTTSRWYIVVAMGRKAGHLALGIGKAAGASITMIGEEFAGQKLTVAYLVDTLVGSIVKRIAEGSPHGVAVLAEGLVELLDEAELEKMGNVERDAHGHIRIAEIPFADVLKAKVQAELEKLGVSMTLVGKNIGYELRCTDPIPFDIEYCRDLGFGAAEALMGGRSAVLVSLHEGNLKAIPFEEIMDPKTGRMRVRMVDTRTDRYRVGRAFTIRLRATDLQDEAMLASIAKVTNLTPAAFQARFAAVAVEPGE
jgi:ATP-dependent phosphofructokinase / diphosphate-dependent phosphofructokinase